MKLSGEETIAAPREAVWAALNDPEILRQCIAGCESFEKISNTSFDVTVVTKVGPLKATFNGRLVLSDFDPPNSCRISAEGKGGVAGLAKGGATVRLRDSGDGGTVVGYDVDARVGGKLAQLGARLIDGTAKRMAGDFFTTFCQVVGSVGAPAAEAVEAAPAAAAPFVAPPPLTPREPARDGLSSKTWILLLVIVVVIVLAVLTT